LAKGGEAFKERLHGGGAGAGKAAGDSVGGSLE